ncbi:MAG: hypothetical protein AAF438_09065 [Pseudomonadota bacterium]
MMRVIFLSLVLLSSAAFADDAKEGDYLYRVTTVRAAPGKLDELISLYQSKDMAAVHRYDGVPFMMRHSQGDHWDLLLIYPMGSFAKHYSMEANARRHRHHKLAVHMEQQLDSLLSFSADTYALGVDQETLAQAFDDYDFYHVEMFHALPGLHEALLEQRRMENRYLKITGQTDNFIFQSVAGTDVDIFTIGFYTSMVDFASSSPPSDEEGERVAREVGFESRGAIGTYLRSLISKHFDTLAVALK